jgi:Lipid A core - O-antigen ligase and related enzymes
VGLLLAKWIFFLLSVGILVYFGWKKPAVLPSFLAGAVAFDISIDWFPSLGPLGSQLGSLARLFTVGTIGAALWLLWRQPEKRQELKQILSHFLSKALLIYIAAGAVSLIYSIGRAKTVVEVVRLLTFFLLYVSICLLAERKHLFLPFYVVHWVGVALVPLALYEGVTRHFIWRGYLAEGMIARVNATFVDPNIFARYLILAIVANLILQFFHTKSKMKIVYYVTLLGLLGALGITLSRSGVVTLAAVLLLMIFLIPRKQIVQPIGILGIIGAVIVASRPTIWQRLLTFREGFGALDAQRKYLMRVAWAMFKDHPIFGVGLGGFQESFTTHYLWMKTVIPYVQGVTLSHTTILTIAGELGVMGLAALAWVWLALARVLKQLRNGLNGLIDRNGLERYISGVGYFLWIVAVFISSQAEARFFEDPMIWIGMGGMMLCLVSELGSEKKTWV